MIAYVRTLENLMTHARFLFGISDFETALIVTGCLTVGWFVAVVVPITPHTHIYRERVAWRGQTTAE